MKITKNMLPVVDSQDFYEIYESGGEKMICFAGYVYPNDGDYDVEWNVLEYCSMEFSLEEYLANPDIYDEEIYSVSEYVDEATEEEVLQTVNNWYDKKDTKPLRLSSLTMATPCGTYLDVDERELSLSEYMVSGLKAQGFTNISLENIQLGNAGAHLDVSYTWHFDGSEKYANYTESFVGYRDGAWYSPLIYRAGKEQDTESELEEERDEIE